MNDKKINKRNKGMNEKEQGEINKIEKKGRECK